MNIAKLQNFLRCANLYGYGTGKGRTASSRLGSKDLEYRDGDWMFHDTYVDGELNDIGTEIIYFRNKPVWGMNYYGRTTYIDTTADELFGFLKGSSIRNVTF
jgi:hypothetical protein